MKKAIRMILVFVVISLLLPGVFVSAEESDISFDEVDWSNVDWSTIDFFEWLSWLPEAELESLFQMVPKADAARAEGVASELGRRFRADPQAIIVALAEQEESIQEKAIRLISYNCAYKPEEFVELMNGLTLPEDAGSEAMQILVQLVQHSEETWNLDITNPHTGDPIGLAALLMAFSGLGTALLWKKRRIVA